MKKYIVAFCSILLVSLLWGAPSTKKVAASKKPTSKSFAQKSTSAAKASVSSTNTNAEQKISFDGTDYFLKYSVGNPGTECLNEYLPKGETFENYTYRFTVRSYDALHGRTPQEVAALMKASLQQKNVDYGAEKWDEQDEGLGFVLFTKSVAELNLFRFTQVNGIPVALQFVYREPLSSRTPQTHTRRDKMDPEGRFLQTVQTKQSHWLKILRSMPVPSVIYTQKTN